MTGIKYDDGKPRLAEMFVDFCIPLEELCKTWEFGANKYTKSNWKQVTNGKDRYTNAMFRHIIGEEKETYDAESKCLHAAHVAFNALARLYFIKKEIECQECSNQQQVSMKEISGNLTKQEVPQPQMGKC